MLIAQGSPEPVKGRPLKEREPCAGAVCILGAGGLLLFGKEPPPDAALFQCGLGWLWQRRRRGWLCRLEGLCNSGCNGLLLRAEARSLQGLQGPCITAAGTTATATATATTPTSTATTTTALRSSCCTPPGQPRGV